MVKGREEDKENVPGDIIKSVKLGNANFCV